MVVVVVVDIDGDGILDGDVRASFPRTLRATASRASPMTLGELDVPDGPYTTPVAMTILGDGGVQVHVAVAVAVDDYDDDDETDDSRGSSSPFNASRA